MAAVGRCVQVRRNAADTVPLELLTGVEGELPVNKYMCGVSIKHPLAGKQHQRETRTTSSFRNTNGAFS